MTLFDRITAENERTRQRKQTRSAERKKEERRRAYRRAHAVVYDAKGGPCMDCGRAYDVVCMDFDHVRGTKKFNLSSSHGYSDATIRAEIAKCDLVCANCHRLRTSKRGPYRGKGKRQIDLGWTRNPATIAELHPT